ncbi:MAG: hypothetical protein U0996_24975 [Planctomycetaceae bacterium]
MKAICFFGGYFPGDAMHIIVMRACELCKERARQFGFQSAEVLDGSVNWIFAQDADVIGVRHADKSCEFRCFSSQVLCAESGYSVVGSSNIFVREDYREFMNLLNSCGRCQH